MSENKTIALVTGASAGLGEEYCRQLAARCDVIIAVARRGERLRRLADELSGQAEVHILEADLLTVEGVTRTLEMICQKGPVDILVNNAGFGVFGSFSDVDIGRQMDLVKIHIETPLRLVRGAVPFMRERGSGHIVNVASVGAFSPLKKSAVYAAAKLFMVSFSQTLAEELKGSGVGVQCFCPGLVRTEIHDGADMAGMDTSIVPEDLWMEAPETVAISLEALEDGPVVVVPGGVNRDIVRGMLKAQAGLLDA